MGLGFRDDGADAADSVFSYRAQAVALPHESNGVEDVLDTEIRVKSLLLISEEEEQQRFRYRAENESKDCSSDFREFTAPGCIEVGTASIKLDEEDRWLVVLVSPSPAFHALARSVETAAEEEFQ
ncbi:hypothetical protein AK812_SmicGene45710, partial [Symbiodinium microadriaticum]